jgi:hypothetical protein
VWYDVGGIIGGTIGGYISDLTRKRSPVLFILLLLSIPSLYAYQGTRNDLSLSNHGDRKLGKTHHLLTVEPRDRDWVHFLCLFKLVQPHHLKKRLVEVPYNIKSTVGTVAP